VDQRFIIGVELSTAIVIN